ncbi:M48 family metalloprotease [Anthocerotibacter panamensis]|uniref:hypothetical protein n=1 Tax=Anthocerotibacter panamensis TaxID=2857077 RepID=UPI001C4076D4|nr:hypothetical protein [Anthocerotibacter panamensis]
MHLIPWPLNFCTALYPVVFVPQNFDRWPPLRRSAVLAHERVHHRQQQALGLLRFCVLYVCDVRFRWRMERRGYQREFYCLLKAGQPPDLKHYARAVSGQLYWRMIDYATALQWFEQVWNEMERTV